MIINTHRISPIMLKASIILSHSLLKSRRLGTRIRSKEKIVSVKNKLNLSSRLLKIMALRNLLSTLRNLIPIKIINLKLFLVTLTNPKSKIIKKQSKVITTVQYS